ncbi:MAG: hypothetical protein AAFQ53_00245 [Bacteroidota bacterium]
MYTALVETTTGTGRAVEVEQARLAHIKLRGVDPGDESAALVLWT